MQHSTDVEVSASESHSATENSDVPLRCFPLELFEMICQLLGHDPLINVALTCRHLCHIALSISWSSVTLFKWIASFPSAIRPTASTAKCFTRTPNCADMQRPLHYAMWIKRLVINEWGGFPIDLGYLHGITSAVVLGHVTPPIMPNLRHLDARSVRQSQHVLYPLIGPSPLLRTLDLVDSHGTSVYLLSSISFPISSPPPLTRLTLQTDTWDASCIPFVNNFITQLRDLQELVAFTSLSSDTVQHLSSLPFLRKLTFQAYSVPDRLGEFGGLEELRLVCSTWPDPGSFVWVKSPRLRSLIVHTAGGSGSGLEPFISLLEGLTSLRELSLHSLFKRDTPPIANPTSLECLLRLPALERLELDFMVKGSGMNPSILPSPQLRVLQLPYTIGVPAMNLALLPVIAKAMPRLKSLTLQLDARVIPVSSPVDITPNSDHPPVRLKILPGSPANNWKSVCEFLLNCLLPNMVELDYPEAAP
jgi:hypothetical protein